MGFDYLSRSIYQNYSDTLSHWALADRHKSLLGPLEFPLHWKHQDIQWQEQTNTTREMRWVSETVQKVLIWPEIYSQVNYSFCSCSAAVLCLTIILQTDSSHCFCRKAPTSFQSPTQQCTSDHKSFNSWSCDKTDLVMDITSNSFLKLHHFKVGFPLTRVKIKALANYYINQYQ